MNVSEIVGAPAPDRDEAIERATVVESLDARARRGMAPLMKEISLAAGATLYRRGEPAAAHRFALLPFDAAVPVRATADELANMLRAFGPALVVDAATGAGQDPSWLAEREREHRFVLYVANQDDASWRATCLRQADEILLVARTGATAAPWPDSAGRTSAQALHRTRRLLLLGNSGAPPPGRAGRWLAQFDEAPALHHLREPADFTRLARHLAQRATALVLSGGGPRGFAHIGVIRALRELHQPIDAVGGTGMGAVVAAALACEWRPEELVQNLRRNFARGIRLPDLPFAPSALAGRLRAAQLTHRLRRSFGERDIEDLALPFCSVSSNLTLGRLDVHVQGKLWKWLRADGATPGLLPPLIDRDQVHVAGAVMNRLPTDVLRDRGLQNIIAVDLDRDFDSAESVWVELAVPRSIHPHMAKAQSEAGRRARPDLATILLRPPQANVAWFDWGGYARAIDAGYRYTMRYFEQNMAGEAADVAADVVTRSDSRKTAAVSRADYSGFDLRPIESTDGRGKVAELIK